MSRVNISVLREELKCLANQCEELREDINTKKSLNGFSKSVRETSSSRGSYDSLYGNQSLMSASKPLPTTIKRDDPRWRKLASDFQMFFNVYTNIIYRRRAMDILMNNADDSAENTAKESGEITLDLINDLDVLIREIDNDLKVQVLKGEDIDLSEERETEVSGEREKALFISHSKKDQPYMEEFVKLLEFIGLHEDIVVCTSVTGFGAHLGDNVYKWLVEKFQFCDLYVLYALSHNYYDSAACLNEMGAAWATKQKWDAILLPGFDFTDIRGCIDEKQISIKLDNGEVSHYLNELKDKLIDEYNLNKLTDAVWERHRDEFLKNVTEIRRKELEKIEAEKNAVDEINDDVDEDYVHTSLKGLTQLNVPLSERQISNDATILLAYASQDEQGQIMVLSDLGGTHIQTCNWDFVGNGGAKEKARWMGAVDELLYTGLIKRVGIKDKIYDVTKQGYEMADAIIIDGEIDVKNCPDEYLIEP